MADFRSLLNPVTLTQVISQTSPDDGRLLEFMGFQYGGPREVHMGHGRDGSFHVYNSLRKAAQGRAPGTSAGRAALQGMKRVPFTYPRMHEQFVLPFEEIHNLARIDDPANRDRAGADMIRRQAGTLAEKARNWRMALTVGMLRDSLYLAVDGDTWYPNYTSGMRVNFQHPAGALNQLALNGTAIIDGYWSNPGSNIVKQLLNLAAGFKQLHGRPLRDVWMSAKTWNDLINNDFVVSAAGNANSPFMNFSRVTGTGPALPDGKPGNPILEYYCEFTWLPGVRFHVSNDGIEVGAPGSEAFVQNIPDDYIVAMVDPETPGVFSCYTGSEPICEYDNAPENVKVGFAAWSNTSSNPSAHNLFILDNALPVNHVPGAVCYGRVSGY